MKRNKVLRFILIVLGLHIVASILFVQLYVSKIPERQSEKKLLEQSDKIDFLILGDSRMQQGIDDGMTGRSFKYTSPHENYIYSYYKLKDLLTKKVKPEYVLLQIDLASFTKAKSEIIPPTAYWVKKMNFFELSSFRKRTDFLYFFKGRLFPYFGEIGDVMHDHEPLMEVKNMQADAQDKIKHFFPEGFIPDESMLAYFEMILVLCEQEGIKLVLLSSPLSDAYLDEFTRTVPRIDAYYQIEMIMGKYNSIVEMLGYQEYFTGHHEYFLNADHLNEAGKKVFSNLLLESLRALDAK